jgi:hypothetical protein
MKARRASGKDNFRFFGFLFVSIEPDACSPAAIIR